MRIRVIGLLAIMAVPAWVLCGLPGLFRYLPPSWELPLYGVRLHVVPFPSETARSALAHHGLPAAEVIAGDLRRRHPILPPNESAYVLAIMQYRGVPLKNGPAHRALREYLRRGDATPADVIAIEFALRAIELDRRPPPSLQPK